MKNSLIKLNVHFFKNSNGKEPVREWLLRLNKDEKKLIGQDIDTIQRKWPIGLPSVASLGNGIREVRSQLSNRIARVLFHIEKDTMISLHGFIKKTQKTPTQELALAKKRLSEWRKER